MVFYRLHDHFFSGRGLSKQAFQVAVDIREEDDAFYVDAEVPGLKAEDIKVEFKIRGSGGIFGRSHRLKAVDGVSLGLPRGRTLAVVGESGSGKTTLGKALLGKKKGEVAEFKAPAGIMRYEILDIEVAI